MTDTTIGQSMGTQNERLDRLTTAVRQLEEMLKPVLNPDMGIKNNPSEDCDLPLATLVITLNGNNDRIAELYSRLFSLADRLAIELPTTEAARTEESDFR